MSLEHEITFDNDIHYAAGLLFLILSITSVYTLRCIVGLFHRGEILSLRVAFLVTIAVKCLHPLIDITAKYILLDEQDAAALLLNSTFFLTLIHLVVSLLSFHLLF